MSSISALQIQGIRSFDIADPQTIKILTPLTLIVGHNGSGKTTIIECLKCATTGDQPPNSKGGAFIHDPKLCGEAEVMAHVKMRLKSVKGATLTVGRRFTLTVKRNNQRAFKTLEGTLHLSSNGETRTLSSKTTELNRVIPDYLGVSKAILNLVIFCHQDESMWPMSTPSDLKKRFDEIFEAMKYTKAVQNIKDIRKKQMADLKVLANDAGHLKNNKDRADQTKRKIDTLVETIDKLREKWDIANGEASEAAEQYQSIYSELVRLSKIVGELEGRKHLRTAKQESIEKLRRNLKPLAESDQELQSMLDQYEERMTLLQQRDDEQKRLYSQNVKSLDNSRIQLESKQKDFGKHQAERDAHERRLEHRVGQVQQTARQYNIRGFDLEIDDHQAQLFMEKLRRMARDQNAVFERVQRENQDERQAALDTVTRLNTDKSALLQRKESARTTIVKNDDKIAELQKEINLINVNEGAESAIKSSTEALQARLDKAKTELASAKVGEQLLELDTEIRSLDDQKEKLDQELLEGTTRAEDSARLNLVHGDLKDRQQGLVTMKGAHEDEMRSTFGHQWSPATIESEFTKVLDQLKGKLTDAEKQRDSLSREMEQLNFKLSTCRNDLKRKRAELKTSAQSLEQTLEIDPTQFPEELDRCEQNVNAVKGDKNGILKEYFEACMDTAEQKHVCRLCRRGFEHDAKGFDSFVKALKANIIRYEQSAVAANEAKEAEDELRLFKSMSSTYDTWNRLEGKDLPAHEADEAQLLSAHEKMTVELEKHDHIVQERATERRDLESLSKTVQSIAKYHTDSVDLQVQMDDLLSKQKSGKQYRAVGEVRDELQRINDQLKSARASIAKVSSDRDRARDEIGVMEGELGRAQTKLGQIAFDLKRIEMFKKQIQDPKSHNTSLRESINKIGEEQKDNTQQLSQAQEKYKEVLRRANEKEGKLHQETQDMKATVGLLAAEEREISAFVDRGGHQQLARAEAAIEQVKQEISKIEREQNDITKEVKHIGAQLGSHEDTKRSICDNQDYRRDMRSLEAVQADIAELESHDPEEEQERLERDRAHWENERTRISTQMNALTGSIQSKDEELAGLWNDWETEYKDAAHRYREAHIKSETTRHAIEDLHRYGGALDKAIMKYHTVKMEEINRIIEELWRRTYQGTDVDTILIRSEGETVKDNKSYNYRVCMVKQDVEMDMRGRCSAGQKVLACIIIRLALAECFGVNCGLIALDEPTTNLDRDNIKALAESLAEIIRFRKQQSNFQLIVITHDEEFLRYMQCSDFADHYYRVHRNDQQKSEIVRQSIAQVMGP